NKRCRKRLDIGEERRWVVERQVADFKIERAVARNNVERGAAADHADVRRRIRYVVGIVASSVAELARPLADVPNDRTCDLDCVDSVRRERGMRFAAAHAAAPAHLALM